MNRYETSRAFTRIVPALDEAPSIARGVENLRGQGTALHRVDNRSSDGTGDIARRAGWYIISTVLRHSRWTKDHPGRKGAR